MNYGPKYGISDNAKSMGRIASGSINFMKMEREQVLSSICVIFYVGNMTQCHWTNVKVASIRLF